MDTLKLPSPSVPTVRLPGQAKFGSAGDDPNKGKTIIVTATTDSVTLNINNTAHTYAVTPNKPTKIVIDEEITSLSQFAYKNTTITALDLSKLKIDNAVNLATAFRECSKLASLLLPNVKVNYIANAFYRAESITSLDASMIDISDVIAVTAVFGSMYKLTTLDISTWDFSRVISTYDFLYSKVLEDLKFGYNLKISTSFQYTSLTHESALSVINGLAEVTTTQTLTFKATTYNTLTDEEIAIATSKGWSVVSA